MHAVLLRHRLRRLFCHSLPDISFRTRPCTHCPLGSGAIIRLAVACPAGIPSTSCRSDATSVPPSRLKEYFEFVAVACVAADAPVLDLEALTPPRCSS